MPTPEEIEREETDFALADMMIGNFVDDFIATFPELEHIGGDQPYDGMMRRMQMTFNQRTGYTS